MVPRSHIRLDEGAVMSTLTTPQPIIRAHDDGARRWFYGGGVHTWKATAEETGGAFLIFEDRMEQGKMTPLHLHPADETMYVLEGEILFHLDGVGHGAGAAGGAARVQRRLLRCADALTTTPRLLQGFLLGCQRADLTRHWRVRPRRL